MIKNHQIREPEKDKKETKDNRGIQNYRPLFVQPPTFL
jgi:hypothetical protein